MGTYPVPGALDVHTSLGERGLHPQTEGAVTAVLGVGVHRVTCTNTPHVNTPSRHHGASTYLNE